MSLIQSARMNEHDPYAYLKDVLTRRPTQRATYVHQLLPHLWSESRLIQEAVPSGMDGQRQPEKYKKSTTDFIESAPGSS